jgi:hypothetical protein
MKSAAYQRENIGVMAAAKIMAVSASKWRWRRKWRMAKGMKMALAKCKLCNQENAESVRK